MGEHGLQSDSAKSRREFSRRMEALCPVDLAGEHEALRRGWKIGAENFADRLADKLARGTRAGVRVGERREIDQVPADRLIQVGLKEVGWDRVDLRRRAKGDLVKVTIARSLHRETPMTRS